MFESFANTPVLVFLLGMAIVAPLLLWQAGRTARLRRENSGLSAEFEQAREILAAAPDGLFIWDHRRGSEKCSRRLAVLLGLEEGTQSQFTHVLARFDANAAANLKAAVRALHRHGTSFELVLNLKDRQFQITGGRAVALDGRVLNDLMWVRELSEAATEPPHKDQADQAAFDHFTLMLDSLPLAVWIRDGQQSVVFANQAARNLGLLEGSSEPIEFADGLAVSEIPARGWAGTIGFAIDPPPQAAPVQDRLEPSVLDHLATAIAIFDRETILSFSNLSFATLWGLDPHWLATAPALGEILDHLRSNRRLPEVTDFKAFRDQQLALFAHLPEPESTLLHLPDGRAIQRFVAPYIDGGLFFSFEDQSGRLDLERSFNALDAVQRETLDHLYEGVAVFGSDGRLKLCNPAFAKIWDLSAAFLDRAPHISDFIDTTRPLIAGSQAMNDSDWQKHVEKVVAKLSAHRSNTGRLSLANGMIVDFSNVALPDGAMLLSYLDVSDSARVEAALRQRAEALDQANRLKSEFIANVSAEVTTPLATLIGYADILAQENYGDLNARQKEYSQGILENAQNLLDVINDILDLATIEAGMMTLQLDTVELHTMLASLVHLIRERARRKNLKVNFDCPPDIGWIVADEKRLRQVLFNLLSNAINFTPARGAVTLKAERRGEAENEAIVFTVSDTGRGIPKSRQMDIFEAFGSADKEETEDETGRTGAGLGLSLVKRFVELHGGSVDIKSPPGRGTAIICTLPASGRKSSSQAGLKIVDQQDSA